MAVIETTDTSQHEIRVMGRGPSMCQAIGNAQAQAAVQGYPTQVRYEVNPLVVNGEYVTVMVYTSLYRVHKQNGTLAYTNRARRS